MTDRAICPICLREFSLVQNGTFRRHKAMPGAEDNCPASGYRPDQIMGAEELFHRNWSEPMWATPPWSERRRGHMTQLTFGPPTKPYTVLDAEGIQKIKDRLGLLLNTSDFGDEMAPAVKHIAETMITQDMPALIAALESPECEDCASIHRVHHAGRIDHGHG